MSKIWIIVKRDIYTYFTDFYGAGFRTVYLVLQLLVFGYILGKVVPPINPAGMTYLQFFALGSVVISLFGASYTIGRDLYLDRESGFLNYMLSLPISRRDIVLGRSLGGAIRSLLHMLILYGIALVIVPSTLLNALCCVALLFVFSFGLCGLGILLATSINQETKWRLVSSFLQLVLVRSSTAMYPAVAMPIWLQVGTRLNPLSSAADSTRSISFNSLVNTPLENIIIVLLFAILMGFAGCTLYSRKVEGGAVES